MQLKEFPVVKYLLIPHDLFRLSHIKQKVILKIIFYLITSCYQPRHQNLVSLKEKGEKEGFFYLKKNCSGEEVELLHEIRFRLRTYILDFNHCLEIILKDANDRKLATPNGSGHSVRDVGSESL